MTDTLTPRNYFESAAVIHGLPALLIAGFLSANKEAWHRFTAVAASDPTLRAEITSMELALECAAQAHRDAISGEASASGNGGNVAVMTTDSAADSLGLSPRRIRQLLSAGLLTGRSSSGRWAVTAESVSRYKENH